MTAYRACAALACLLLFEAGAARSNAESVKVEAAKYLSLCRKFGVRSGTANASNEKAYEIRGALSGVAVSPDSYNLLIRTGGGSTINLMGSGTAPSLDLNTAVRILISGTDPAAEDGSLPILAITTEADAAKEQAKNPKAGAKPTANRSATRRNAVSLTSRNLTRPRVEVASPESTLKAYEDAIRYFNRTGSPEEIETIARAVLAFSVKYQVDARLVMAVFACESGFHSDSRSHSGAMGIGQLMPGTAAALGVSDAYDPVQNIEGAIKYLRLQLDRYQGKDEWTKLQLVLASYNAGPNAVKKYNGVPPYQETQAYVRKVSQWYLRFLGVK
jgi:hypothetical protein